MNRAAVQSYTMYHYTSALPSFNVIQCIPCSSFHCIALNGTAVQSYILSLYLNALSNASASLQCIACLSFHCIEHPSTVLHWTGLQCTLKSYTITISECTVTVQCIGLITVHSMFILPLHCIVLHLTGLQCNITISEALSNASASSQCIAATAAWSYLRWGFWRSSRVKTSDLFVKGGCEGQTGCWKW